ILNNDNWLMAKKGRAFMPHTERMEILNEFPFVDRVYLTDHKMDDSDLSVVRALRKLRPSVFANGGDRKPDGDPVPEVAVCRELHDRVHTMTAAERMLRWILIGGIFALPLVPFIVSYTMFFPYIVGKNFTFRILVEIMTGAYIALAVVLPKYRPRRSFLLIA